MTSKTRRFDLPRAAILAVLPLLVASTTLAQDDKKAQDSKKPDPKALSAEVKAKSATYQKLVLDREGSKDAEAIATLDALMANYAHMTKSDRGKLLRSVNRTFSNPRVKREPVNAGLFRSTMRALGTMEAAGSAALAKAYENKKFKGREWVTLRGEILEQIGRTKDPKRTKMLLDVACRAEQDALRAKAGLALGNFHDAPVAQRKEIAKKMIREFASIAANADPLKAMSTSEPSVAQQVIRSQRRLEAVRGVWNSTLQKLTKQKITDPLKWQSFYNTKEWKRNWDKPEKGKTRR